MRRNNVRDFIVNGAVLGVTHMLVLTRGELSVNLRIMRIAQGPTITFRSQIFIWLSYKDVHFLNNFYYPLLEKKIIVRKIYKVHLQFLREKNYRFSSGVYNNEKRNRVEGQRK